MNTCAQSLALIVAPQAGPNWANMVWDVVHFGFYGGSGSGSITADGNAVTAFVSGASATLCYTQLHGSLLYTGPAVNCQLVVSAASTPGSLSQVAIIQDGNVIFAGLIPAAGQNIAFSLLAGINSVIEVEGNANDGFDAYVLCYTSGGINTFATFTLKNA